LPHELGLLAYARGQGGAELQPRGVRGFLEAELREQRGGAREEQRADLGRRQARQLRLVAVDEAPAAARAALGDHGHAGAAERVHVAQDRALRDLEARRQRLGRHAAVGLEQ
jgi:hypothetical protein